MHKKVSGVLSFGKGAKPYGEKSVLHDDQSAFDDNRSVSVNSEYFTPKFKFRKRYDDGKPIHFFMLDN